MGPRVRRPSKAEKARREFNQARVELWQLALKPGDHFVLTVLPGVIFYGEVLSPPPDADTDDPNVRWTRTYSEAWPEGVDDLLEVHMADLPLTREQFELAEELGWPSETAAFRAVVGMTQPGVS